MVRRRRALWPGVALLLAAAIVGVQAVLPADEPAALPDDDCPATTGLAAILLDLEALGAGWRGRAAALLREVARDLPPSTELRLYRVPGQAAAPLSLVGRLCAPDAAMLPATCLTPNERVAATDTPYCDRLRAAEARIDELSKVVEATATSAYLVEAIDAVRREFAGIPGHRSLHVLSDMMQHAERRPYLDSAPEEWRLPVFADNGGTATTPGGAAPGEPVPASIHYLPRPDSTVAPDVRITQDLWRARLAAAGFAPTFHDQPATSAHETRTPTRLARLTQQREDLTRDQARLAELLSRLNAAREGLGQARIRAEEDRRALVSRREELRTQHAAERQRLSAERTESARLRAALARRAQGDGR